MNEKLKPCQFCGAGKITVFTVVLGEMSYADCERCHARGPRVEGADAARRAWNSRGPATAKALGTIGEMTTGDKMELAQFLGLSFPDEFAAFIAEHEPATPTSLLPKEEP